MADFELKVEVREIPLSQLSENTGQIPDVPENPRKISDEAFALLKKSITESPEMKQLDEIKVFPWKKGFVAIGGNHRLRAYKELGWQNALCKVLPKDTPKEKLCEYIMKENMQYAKNDPYKLESWDKEQLKDWGVELPPALLDMNKFFEEPEKKVQPHKDAKYEVLIPAGDNYSEEEVYMEILAVCNQYQGVKVKKL